MRNEKTGVGRLIIGVLALIGAFTLRAEISDWLPNAVTPTEEWRQLPLDAVRLGGEFGRRVNLTKDDLLKVDPDKSFFRFFRARDNKGYHRIGYAGFGKYLDANVVMARHTGDPEMIRRKDYVIAETLKTQGEDGYIGGFREKRLEKEWDAHEVAYVITALVTDWEEFGNRNALKGACRLADYVLAYWKDLPDDWGRTWCAVSMYTIGQCHALLRLYSATGDKRYLNFCLNERHLADNDIPLYVGRDNMVYGHTYCYINECLAQQQLYRLQGCREGRLLVPTARGLDTLFNRNGAVVSGLNGIAECWNVAQDGDGAVGETCSTCYSLYCYDSMMRLGVGDTARLGDAVERTVYNGLFPAESPDGRQHRYYTPLLGERTYFAVNVPGEGRDPDIYCCPNNFRRAIGRLAQFVYHVRSNALRVNLFTASEAACVINGVNVKVTQETDYPTSGKVRIMVNPERETAFGVFVRVPKWCRRPTIRLCGNVYNQVCAGGQYLQLTKVWKKGDVIELDYPMEIRAVRGRARQSGRFCVLRGPVLYGFNPKVQEGGDVRMAQNVKNLMQAHPFDIQHRMSVDPTTLALAADPNDVARPGGTAVEALAGLTHDTVGVAQGFVIRIRLTEFADPGNAITYFRAPDIERQVTEDDEIFRGPAD